MQENQVKESSGIEPDPFPDQTEERESQDRLMTVCFNDGFNRGYRAGIEDFKTAIWILVLSMMLASIIVTRYSSGTE